MIGKDDGKTQTSGSDILDDEQVNVSCSVTAPVDESKNKHLNDKYPHCCSAFEENRWVQSALYNVKISVRKQARSPLHMDNIPKNDIALETLIGCAGSDENNDIWYHATRWESALKIIEEGLKKSQSRSDLAPRGAIYLNPDYRDCYEWFHKRDRLFRGEHAMLIFKCSPEELSSKGKRISRKKE